MRLDSLVRNPRVALILEIPPDKEHLYQALREANITVVSECRAGDLDPVELAGADVVLVMLDEGLEPHLERVTNLVCGARMPVVFDDCRISRDLSGWERNRWARHLLAKLTGSGDTRPPIPENLVDLEAENDALIEPESESAFESNIERNTKIDAKLEPANDVSADDALVWVLCAAIGGPEAVRRFLEFVPGKAPMAFILVQRMSADFQRALSKRLRRSTLLEVTEAADGDRPKPGCLLVVPLNGRFGIEKDGSLHFDRDVECPATLEIDRVLFEFAEVYGGRTNAIIFNGYGRDGVAGCAKLKQLGGTIMAQDMDEAALGSTINALKEAGLVDFSGTPERLAQYFIAS